MGWTMVACFIFACGGFAIGWSARSLKGDLDTRTLDPTWERRQRALRRAAGDHGGE